MSRVNTLGMWLLIAAFVVVSLIAVRTLIVHFQADGTPDTPVIELTP